MKLAFSLAAVSALVLSLGLANPASAQEVLRDQGGISSPLLSRCAGHFGSQLRAADSAFPLFSLMGVPWMAVEQTNQTVDGAHVVAIVTGIGTRNRRRGEVATLRYRCLIDDKGAAVSFTWTDSASDRPDALSSALMVRGSAYYRPRAQLAPGSELRVQLFDLASTPPLLITEEVVRSSWVEPIPFSLRLPSDMKMQGRKLALDVRLSLGSSTLYRLKQPVALDLDQLTKPVDVTIDAVVHTTVQ